MGATAVMLQARYLVITRIPSPNTSPNPNAVMLQALSETNDSGGGGCQDSMIFCAGHGHGL